MKKSKKIRGTMTRTRRVLSLILLSMLSLTSCEVVRTITTTSEYKQVDSADVVIQTKVTESYVGSKKS